MTDTPNTIWPKTQWVNRTRNWLAGDYDAEQLELPGMPEAPEQPDETGARMLPFVLHAMADKGGHVTPRQKRLATVCGVDVRSVRRWIARLKRRGLMVIPDGMIGYRGKATTYRLVQPDWLVARAEAKEKADSAVPLKVIKADSGVPLNQGKADTGVQKGDTGVRPGRDYKGIKGEGDAVRAERLAKTTAAALDANHPLEDSDDPGCDAHKWNGSDRPCGGCRDARNRQQQRQQREKQQRQAAAEKADSEMWRREFDRAEANAVTGPDAIGIVERKRRELEAAEPAEPDNPDPQAEHVCTHGKDGRPADARGPKRCSTCKANLTPEQLQRAQDAHTARARAKASA